MDSQAEGSSSTSSVPSLWSSILASSERAGSSSSRTRSTKSGAGGAGAGQGSKRVIVLGVLQPMVPKYSVSQSYACPLKTGPHGSGKSTLVRSLGRRGQYSDSRTASASTSSNARSDKGKGVDYDTQDSADLAINFEYLDLNGVADAAEDGTVCSSHCIRWVLIKTIRFPDCHSTCYSSNTTLDSRK